MELKISLSEFETQLLLQELFLHRKHLIDNNQVRFLGKDFERVKKRLNRNKKQDPLNLRISEREIKYLRKVLFQSFIHQLRYDKSSKVNPRVHSVYLKLGRLVNESQDQMAEVMNVLI